MSRHPQMINIAPNFDSYQFSSRFCNLYEVLLLPPLPNLFWTTESVHSLLLFEI